MSECSSTQDESNHEQLTLPVETSIPQTAVPTSDIASKLAPASWTGISDQNASCPTTLQAADRVEFTDTTVCKTYSLMGDNPDTNVKPRFKRIDNQQEKSLCYFHRLAIRDKISQLSQLPITPCHTCNNSPEKMARPLLPTTKSDSALTDVMIIIVSRVLITHLSYFQFACSDVVTWHMEHQYYKEMSTKSDVVCIIMYTLPSYILSFNRCP